jgi:hypothetical protein
MGHGLNHRLDRHKFVSIARYTTQANARSLLLFFGSRAMAFAALANLLSEARTARGVFAF